MNFISLFADVTAAKGRLIQSNAGTKLSREDWHGGRHFGGLCGVGGGIHLLTEAESERQYRGVWEPAANAALHL